MDVGMKRERLTPGMEHSEDAEVGAELRSSEIEQGPAGGAEQDRIDHLGSAEGQSIEALGDGEDDVKVGNVEDLLASCLEPVLAGLTPAAGTVAIATGVPEDVLVAAAITVVAMTAQGRGT